MNRQLKRVIAFVLVSVMSLSLLAGCGKEKKQVVNDVDTTEYITRGEWISRLVMIIMLKKELIYHF